jgi:hypothetical protein
VVLVKRMGIMTIIQSLWKLDGYVGDVIMIGIGKINKSCRPATNLRKGREMKVEEIAKVAHEVNRAYCQAIGDNSQPTWEEAPGWQRDSAINGVLLHLSNDLGAGSFSCGLDERKVGTRMVLWGR